MERTYVQPLKTMMEVFQSLPEGTRVQLINNQLVMSPAPTDAHQKVLNIINRRLSDFVEANGLGEIRIGPYDVYLDRKNAFQPDLLFIAKESLHKIKSNGLHGAPDLVIEVFSPATRRYDEGRKKDIYERNGVKEYWLVDPVTKQTAGFYLVNDGFQPLSSEPETLPFHLLNYTLQF